jgi:hypothetical protein
MLENTVNLQKKINRICDLRSEEFKIDYTRNYTIAGSVASMDIRMTKKTKVKWATLLVEDFWASIQVLAFEKVFSASAWLFDKNEYDQPIMITCYLHNKSDDRHGKEGLQFIATEIKPLTVEQLKPELYTAMNLQSVQNQVK